MPELKYYDKYTSDNANTACNGNDCLSHGLSETAGWYNDSRTMLSEEYPWLVHGGTSVDSSFAGIFYFVRTTSQGGISSNGSFRLTLAFSN